MTVVERLDDPTDCDRCGRELLAGEIVAVDHVPVPIYGDEIDWVPVITDCARCAEIPIGFQPGWNLYCVAEGNILQFAEESGEDTAARSFGSAEITAALHTIARIRHYLLCRSLSRHSKLSPRRSSIRHA